MSDLVTTYVSVPSQDVALDMSRRLVKEKLIACANILGPGTSIYSWSDQIREDVEWYLLLKTTQDLLSQVMQRIKDLHPYECPAITTWKHEITHPDYLDWVHKNTI